MKSVLIAALVLVPSLAFAAPAVVPPVVVPPPFIISVGAGQIFCSGPLAPGWHVDLPNGGCPTSNSFGGTTPVFFKFGETVNGLFCPFTVGCQIH